VHQIAVRTAEFLDRPGSLIHAHPHSLARAREFHHEAAARHDVWPVIGIMRLAWGYGHMLLIKPVLNLLEWFTETPLRFAALIAFVAVVYFFR
jgi:hypothetical protein